MAPIFLLNTQSLGHMSVISKYIAMLYIRLQASEQMFSAGDWFKYNFLAIVLPVKME